MTALSNANVTYGPSTHRAARSTRAPVHIPSLDGIRAISFFIVFLSHAELGFIPGGFGVTVFFFLSGYLITTLMRAEAESTGTVNLKLFYARRALRILPPFYIVLVLATSMAWIGLLPGGLRFAPVAAQALHVENYWAARYGSAGQAAGTIIYWSLAVEEHFYLLFPGLFLLLCRLDLSGRRKAHVLWALCGVVLLWRCILLLVIHAEPYRVTYGTDTRLDSILFGCALAVHRNPALDPHTDGSERLWKRVVVPFGLVVLLVSIAIPNPTFRETIRYSVQGIALYPLFIAAIRWPKWGVFRILNLRPVRFVGTLSYSLYLVHYVALSFVRAEVPLPHFLIAPVALLIAFGAAWLIWWTVEKPCAILRKRLASLPTASVRVSAGS